MKRHRGAQPHRLDVVLPVTCLLTAILPLIILAQHNINWDEFRYLSHVYAYEQNRLEFVLQTGYVHLFGWLTDVGFHEVDQILAGRLASYAAILGSAVLLYRVGRRLLSKSASCVVVVAFFCFSSVMIHGVAFRVDSWALFLHLAALDLVVGRAGDWRRIAGAGVLVGLACFLTVKSAIPAAAVVALLLVGHTDHRERLNARARRVALFGASATVVFALLLAVHAAVTDGGREAINHLGDAGKKTVFDAGFLPQPATLVLSLWQNPTTWSLIVVGGGVLLLRVARDDRRRLSLMLLCLLLPVLSIFFYRNSFPYFYVMIVPSAMILAGLAYDVIVAAVRRAPAIALIVPLLIVVDAIPTFNSRSEDTIARQRVIIEAVHEMFPVPVPYIDGVSMIASYPKIGFFMSSWGLENYVENSEPIFEAMIAATPPAFLLADAADLEVFGHVYRSENSVGSRLFDEDKETLRSQFIHHWGPVYVPGTQIAMQPDSVYRWKNLIPGSYRVEADGAVRIAGVEYQPGEVAHLGAAIHSFDCDSCATLTLRSNRARRPSALPPETPIFLGL